MEETQPLLPGPNPKRQKDNITRVEVPKKRKHRATWASCCICISVGIGIIIYGVKYDKVQEYKPVNDLSAPVLNAISNGSITCYMKKEKKTYPVLFNLCFGLVSIIIGTFVDRLSLIFEEIFHFKTRYKRNFRKMVKACFSGIQWLAVIPLFGLLILIIIAILLSKNAKLEWIYVTYILSGIGIGPLVMHLLNMNTHSEVHVSTILEERQTFVANGLAWDYYFNYLNNALPKLKEKIPNINSNVPVQDQRELVRLNSNKLILLISHDCVTKDNLEEQDNMINKLGEIKNGKFRFPVYQLTYGGQQYRYVIKYVMQPLQTLQMMSEKERIKALTEKELDYQVQMFYETLSHILEKPFNNDFRDSCILVPIKTESSTSLQNGGLVRFIMHEITTDRSTSDNKKGFMIVPPAQKTRQSEAIGDCSTSAPDGEDHSVMIDGNEVNNSEIQPVQEEQNGNTSQLSTQTEQERRPSHNDDTGISIRVDIHCDPKQNRESKGTQTTSPKEKMDDRQATANNEQMESGGTSENNQSMSCNTTHEKKEPRSRPTSFTSTNNLETGEDRSENIDGSSSIGNAPPILKDTEDTKDESMSSGLVDDRKNDCSEPAENGTLDQSTTSF